MVCVHGSVCACVWDSVTCWGIVAGGSGRAEPRVLTELWGMLRGSWVSACFHLCPTAAIHRRWLALLTPSTFTSTAAWHRWWANNSEWGGVEGLCRSFVAKILWTDSVNRKYLSFVAHFHPRKFRPPGDRKWLHSHAFSVQ